MKVNTTTIEDRSNGLERETDVSKKESHDILFKTGNKYRYKSTAHCEICGTFDAYLIKGHFLCQSCFQKIKVNSKQPKPPASSCSSIKGGIPAPDPDLRDKY